jgi:hypothetical protein
MMPLRRITGDWLMAILAVGLYFLTTSLTQAEQAAPLAGDAAKGKVLHDGKCTSCHVERFGGDGSEIYLRRNRLINDANALKQRVAMCASQINAGWFPDDEENVTAYLAKRYYKFR